MSPTARGIRNAFRNHIRTGAIVTILGLSIGLCLAMLIANKAVSDRINSVKSSVGNTITVSPAGYNPGSQANNALTTSELASLKSVSHVTKVTETVTDRLSTTGSSTPSFGGRSDSSSSTTSLTSPVTLNLNRNGNGNGPRAFVSGGGGSLPANFSLPISFLGTTDPTQVDDSAITIKSGSTIDPNKDSNDAIVSSAMAKKNNLKVGSTFQAYNQNLTVAGIFTGSTQGSNGTVILSLPAEQRLSGQSGAVTSAMVTVDSLDNLSNATNTVKKALGSSADVVSSQQQADNTVKPLNSVKSISFFSLIGAVVAGAIIILMVMIMIVRERQREIGVLKAIGGTNGKIVGQFTAEAITLTGMGAVVGIILGIIAGNPITNLLVSNSTSTGSGMGGFGGPGGGMIRAGGRGFGAVGNSVSNIHAVVGWSIILYGLLAALVIALIGSALTSFFITKIRPADVMRAE